MSDTNSDKRPTGNLAASVKDQWVEILSVLAPELEEALDNYNSKVPHVPCPGHGGTDGFRLFKDVNSTGGGVCNTCGYFKDGFRLLAWINTVREHGSTPTGYKPAEDTAGMKTAYGDVAYYKNHGAARNPELRNRVARVEKGLSEEELRKKEEELKQRKEWIMKVSKEFWEACVPATYTWDKNDSNAPFNNYVNRYFEGRGLTDIYLPPLLRFNPKTLYTGESEAFYFPGIVSPVTRVDNGTLKVVGLHRIYLETKPDGTVSKAPVASPKKILPWGDLEGSCIRLYPLEGSRTLVFTEGIETAVAVNKLTGLPVWPCVTAWGMEHVQIPDDVDTILIAQDFDISGKGQSSADALAARVKAAGKVPIIVSPEQFYIPSKHPKGVDWDDACKEDFARAQAAWAPYMSVATPDMNP